MERDPFSYKYPLKLNSLNICEYIPRIIFASSGTINVNNYQLLKTSSVTAIDTSTDTATAIGTATDSETPTITYSKTATATAT
jgi:hypothetical protein